MGDKMETLSLREFAVPMIKAIDSFNYLLKSHHRRVAIISYYIGKELGLSDSELTELVIAASLHDIGALSAQEKNMLLEEDIKTPLPHCIMGYKMLASFQPFAKIARIIRYHHINYQESQTDNGIPLESYIIHLADRVDILLSSNESIENQNDKIVSRIKRKRGTIFHPQVVDAFDVVIRSDSVVSNINDWSIEHLFNELQVTIDSDYSIDTLIKFALVVSRIIDYRSHFTSAHSYTVAHLASLIGSYLDFAPQMCQKLMVAGYLYDIGKIAIPPAQLEEEEKINDTEFNRKKKHIYYTGQILNELSACDWFAQIIVWVENQGLDMNEKTLDTGGKILAFADLIAALMESRPYREALSIEDAFNIIREQMTDALSIEIFHEIEGQQQEIDALVFECQQHAFEEYNQALELVINSNY